MLGRRRSVSATVGAIFVIVLLIAAVSTILLYNQFFTSSGRQAVREGELENAKVKETLKVIPQSSPKILVQNAWGRDSIIRYILTLDVNDIVQSSTEVNITVPADSSVTIDLQAHGVPIGSKYMFVTALGNSFGPVSFTYVLIVYVCNDGTSTGVQGVIVQVDDAQYSTDANGMVSTLVPYGNHTIGIVSSNPGTGVQYVFTKWSDGSTSNPRVFQISQPTVLTAYAKVRYLLTVNVNPSNGGTVSPGTGWYDASSTVTISASSNSGFRFGSWSGSGLGSYTGISNPASVTMDGPITETANFIQVATVTFSASGLSSDASGTVLVVDSVGYGFNQLPKSFTWDVGSSHSFSWTSPVPAGSGKWYVWTGTSGLSTSQSGTIAVPSGGGNVVASYKTQYTVTIQTSGLPSDLTGNSVVFDNNGYRVYDGSPVTLWVDAGRTVGYSWSSPISSNTNGKRYVITSSQSGSVTVDGPKTVSASYKTQYYLTVNSAYDSPNPTSNWFDAGSSVTASVTSPVSGGSGVQYVCTGWSGTGSVPSSGAGTSVTFVITAPSSITWNWKTQYYLTMQVNPSGGGTVSPSSGWYDSGVQVQISATPASNYRFNGWSGSGSGSYSGSNNPATVAVNGPITETANFVQTAAVTFSVSGIGSDASGTILTVDGTSYSYSQLPKSFTWDVGSSHSFSWTSPISAGSGKQYVWTSTSGLSTSQSGSINVPSEGGSVTASYKTQYYLTMQVNSSGGGSVNPSSGWCDAGASVQISATPSSSYRFDHWTGSGTGSYSGTSNPATVTVNGPITETAYFIQTATVTFSASSLGSDASGTVLTFDGNSYSYSSLPKSFTCDVGSSHNFAWSDPVSTTASDKRYVWTSTSGLSTAKSGTITVPSGGGSVSATYKTQHLWTFSASGLGSDASGTVVTVDGAGYAYSSLPASFWWDSGSSHSYSYQGYVSSTAGGKRYANHAPPSATVTVSSSGNIAPSYHVEYLLTISVNPSGGGSVSASLSSSDWYYDSGTIVTLTASANSGYVFDAWTGDASCTSNPTSVVMDSPKSVTANFFTFSISVNPKSGSVQQGGSTSATVTVTYVSGVNSKTITFSASNLPSSASASFSPSSVTISPSSSTASTTMAITTSTSTPTGTYAITVTGSGGGLSKSASYTLTVTLPAYSVNFYVYDDASSAVSGATINFAGSSYSHGGSASVTSGSYSLSTGTIPSGYRFKQWETSGSVSVSSSTSSSTAATVSGSGSITMRLQRIATVTFSVSGLSSDASGTILTVDGASYSLSQLPASNTWDVGSSHSFSWTSPVSAGSGKQYVWVSTSGLSTSQSGSINVPSGGGSVTASYKTQYYLTVSSAYDSPTPSSGWFDAGSSITASVTSPVSGGSGIQYVCTGWSGIGSAPSSGTSTSTTFTINAPSSITWNWKTQYYLTMNVNPYGAGSVSPGSGWFDGGAQVQITATPSTGYGFVSWTGSGPGSYTGFSSSATVTMNGPVTETANFNNWLTGWQYRKRHAINPVSGAGTDYPVQITVYYGSGTDSGESVYLNGKCKSDFSDIRFTKADGSTLLNYWMENMVQGSYAVFWVKVSDDLSTNPVTIYLYYGNPLTSRADDPQSLDLWQLREHTTMIGYSPNIVFTKSSSSVIRADSYSGGAGPLGEGDIFIIMPRDWLNGKKIQIYWNGYFSIALSREIANVEVLNVELNRKQSIAVNWLDSIYTYSKLASYTASSSSAGWTGWRTTTSGTISISSFSSKYVTLAIRCTDAWAGQTVMLNVDWIKILDANNNVLIAYDFTNSVVMEVTGTCEDYGLYRKHVSSEPSHGEWSSQEIAGWLSGWSYRNYHVINGVSVPLSNYQVRITVYYGSGTSSGDTVYLNGLCKRDFSDLRFTGPDGVTLLPYWIESYTASSVAYVWVKIPSIPASGSTVFYLYYGNPSASSASDDASTFLFFDDFTGSSLDTSKWDVRTTSGGTYSVSGDVLTITVQSDGVNWKEVALHSYTTLPSKCEIRAKVKWTYSSEHESWIMNYYVDPSNLQAMGYRGYSDYYVSRTVMSGTVYDRNYGLSNDNPANYEWWSLSFDGTTLAFKRTTSLSGTWTTLSSTSSNVISSGFTAGIRDAVKGSTANYFYIDYIFARNFNDPEPSHGAWG